MLVHTRYLVFYWNSFTLIVADRPPQLALFVQFFPRQKSPVTRSKYKEGMPFRNNSALSSTPMKRNCYLQGDLPIALEHWKWYSLHDKINIFFNGLRSIHSSAVFSTLDLTKSKKDSSCSYKSPPTSILLPHFCKERLFTRCIRISWGTSINTAYGKKG